MFPAPQHGIMRSTRKKIVNIEEEKKKGIKMVNKHKEKDKCRDIRRRGKARQAYIRKISCLGEELVVFFVRFRVWFLKSSARISFGFSQTTPHASKFRKHSFFSSFFSLALFNFLLTRPTIVRSSAKASQSTQLFFLPFASHASYIFCLVILL